LILLAFGTRPEYLKIKPLIEEFDQEEISYKLLFTGQHKDLLKDIEVDQEIKIPNSGNRLDRVVGSVMNNIIWSGIDFVLVQGDTTSVLAVALSAFHNQKKVIHLEAGLRTYDKQNPYPEETNRRIVSAIAEIHLCPTELSKQNLITEKIEGDIYVVGNTVLDNLKQYKDECEYTNKILVTLHRRENHLLIDKWFQQINKLAEDYSDYEFILPIHPNPNVQKHKDLLTNVKVVDPLPYNELLELLVKTRLVITDSGGLQEECSFFNKKCLVCRKITERPESLGLTSFLVETPDRLRLMFDQHIDKYDLDIQCPYGDGNSASRIIEILSKLDS
jgi:UDP-N-acetylglucosamine 2-epimerase